MIKKIIISSFLTLCIATVVNATLPVSREASIIEVVSASEVSIEGVGIYKSSEKSRRKRKKDVKKYGQEKAIEDAKRAAVYYLIFNGTDPLLSTPEEINRFNKIENDFFQQENINELITYTAAQPNKVISLDRREGVKVYMNFKVNMTFLRQLLEENLVVFSQKELSEELGYPQIMVLPVAASGKEALDVLKSDKKVQHAAGVIESYLTAKKYDVIVPAQLNAINNLTKSIQSVKKTKSDEVYQLALSIGSDIYLDYSIGQTKSAYNTDQVSVTVRAYETTTGRLLATETGYSKPRVGEEFVSIEEGLLAAMTNVTQRIMTYWEDDLARGVQYKVITSIVRKQLSEEALESIQEDLLDSFDEIANIVKENVVTDRTIDVSLWCDNEKISDSRKLFKQIRSEFRLKQSSMLLKQVNRNRKLIILEIK